MACAGTWRTLCIRGLQARPGQARPGPTLTGKLPPREEQPGGSVKSCQSYDKEISVNQLLEICKMTRGEIVYYSGPTRGNHTRLHLSEAARPRLMPI